MDDHNSADLPAVKFLRDLIEGILKDGIVTEAERRELIIGIERVLPKDVRDIVSPIRKGIEDEDRKNNSRIDAFNFMIAGAKRHEYQKRIEGNVNEGDAIYFIREPKNVADENAVKIYVRKDLHIGYVPREYAYDMAELLDEGMKYRAKVKKVLDQYKLIPVVFAEFFNDEAEVEGTRKSSDPIPASPPAQSSGCLALTLLLSVILVFIMLFILF